MTVIDFIDVIDDIIDLSSDEETVQQDHTVTQHRAPSLDRQAVFVLAGERRQDAQAVFVSAVEGSQAATEFGNALVATASPSVTEKTPLHSAESQNCPSSPRSPFPSLTSTTPKVLSSEVSDAEQDVFVLAGEGMQDGQSALDLASDGSQKDTEFGNPLLATASPLVMEKVPLDMAEPKNCPSSPTSAPLPSSATITPKALTSEGRDTKPAGVKHPKKNYHIGTPRRSPRFEQEQPAADHKRSRMLESAEESAPPTDDAESTKTLSSLATATPKALTSERCDTKPARVKHPKKNYHIGTLRRSPRFEQMRECCNDPEEQPAADHKRSRMLRVSRRISSPYRRCRIYKGRVN